MDPNVSNLVRRCVCVCVCMHALAKSRITKFKQSRKNFLNCQTHHRQDAEKQRLKEIKGIREVERV